VGTACQRLDLAAMGEAAAIVAVQLGCNVAGLHHDHVHVVFAVQLLGGQRERRDVSLVPVEDQQVARTVAVKVAARARDFSAKFPTITVSKAT
jgi:hypothetical protein